MNDAAGARRIYRLWRTSAILCGVGAVEFVFLAWQRGVAWIAAAAIPLVTVSIVATRRAARIRRSWGPEK